jgi:hypothetical protein
MKTTLDLAYEDQLSGAVLQRIIQHSRSHEIGRKFCRQGNGYLKKNIRGFNSAARISPIILLTDLDRVECPPTLIREWLPNERHPQFIFNVAVRSVESWLLADRSTFASFLTISEKAIPPEPEFIPDPKQCVIALARKSRSRAIRDALVPPRGRVARTGPDYNGTLCRYVADMWNPAVAARNAESLQRLLLCLDSFGSKT